VELTRLSALSNLLGKRSFSRALDIGCGSGDFTLGYARCLRLDQVFGVDVSEETVEEARARGVVAVCVDLNKDNLPFADNTFDLVVMAEVIEHLENVEHTMDEVARVVTPGGYLAITTPNLASWHGRLSLLLGYQPFTLDVGLRRHYGSLLTVSGKSAGHIRGFTLPALRELLSSFGFRVIGISSAPGVASGDSFILDLLRTLDRAISRVPRLASGLVVAARSTKHASDAHTIS